MKLFEKLVGEPFIQIVKIRDLEFEFRILTKKESLEILNSVLKDETLGQLEQLKLKILSKSIISIDKIRIEDYDEIKNLMAQNKTKEEAIIEFLLGLPTPVYELLYRKYTELQDKYNQSIENIKKN